MNIFDILIIAVITVACYFAFRHVRKNGTCDYGSCGGNCAGCSACHHKNPPMKKGEQ